MGSLRKLLYAPITIFSSNDFLAKQKTSINWSAEHAHIIPIIFWRNFQAKKKMTKAVEKIFYLFFFFSEFFVEKTQSNCLKSLITKILDACANILRNKTEKLKSIPERFSYKKVVLKPCSKFSGEHPCVSVISIQLESNYRNHASTLVSCKFAASFQNTF